jgi:calcineurin-like phosphoesterase family protein
MTIQIPIRLGLLQILEENETKNNVYITSDSHHFHRKIEEYANRPSNWQDLIIDNWMNTIKDTDIIIHLGDFALGNISQIEEILSILKGKIILLPGNHDKGRQLKYYKKNMFMTVEENQIEYKNFIFTHRPMNIIPNGFINVAGHTHNITPKQNNRLNVSIENTAYKPIKLKELLEGKYEGNLITYPPYNSILID